MTDITLQHYSAYESLKLRRHPGGVLELIDQVVHVGAAVQRNPLALELGHRLDRRILGDKNLLGPRRGRLAGDVTQVSASSLGKHGRRFPHAGEIDAAHVQAFQHLRASSEFHPPDSPALCFQMLVQIATRLQDGEIGSISYEEYNSELII